MRYGRGQSHFTEFIISWCMLQGENYAAWRYLVTCVYHHVSDLCLFRLLAPLWCGLVGRSLRRTRSVCARS